MKVYEELRWFLIRTFIVILAIVGVVEYAVLGLVNRLILPVVAEELFPEYTKMLDFNSFELVVILILVLLSLLVWGVQQLLPRPAQMAVQWIADGLDRFAAALAPSSQGGVELAQMDTGRRALLALVMFATVVLVLLPFAVGAFVYAHIITREFAKIEAQRDEVRREYDQRRNLMLSDIAHDLRTPITTVSGYAAALADGMAEPERQQEYLDAIRNKSVRMNDLITLLFDYVKLDSDGFSLDMETLDICELLRENAALIYSDVENAGMELVVEIPEKRIEVEADRIQMSRVVTNLLTNAMRHNGPGSRIGLYLIEDEDCLRVAVADTGACIAPELEEHLFEPFAKGDASRNSGGSGLGLSIAQKVVQMHGWELSLVQQPQIQKLPGLARYAKAFVIKKIL